MISRAPSLLCALAAILAACLPAFPAHANGVFPTAGQIVIDPSDPQHIVVRTTYGILTTREAGEPWDWICEGAVGYGGTFHPAVAITADGTVIAGLTDGLAVAHADTCAWAKAAGAIDGAYVVDVSTEKNAPSHAVAVTSNGVSGTSRFWSSDDDAVTWTQAGTDLPAGFLPVSVDVAPSDPMRVYVSGLSGGAGTLKGALVVSSDRGKTWTQLAVPSSDGGHAPYIGAIDPAAPDRVYLRTDGSPGRLFAFDRATETFTEIFVGQGFLRGFALSPGGDTVLVGGSSDGIWRAPTTTLAFEKVSPVATRCLTWTAAGVYTCATEFADGFTVGLSADQGATFAAVMHLPCVRGPLACGAGTSVDTTCPAEWPAVAMLIGQDTCAPGTTTGAGGSSSGSSGGAGSSAGGQGGGAITSTGQGGTAGAGTSTAPDAPSSSSTGPTGAGGAGAADDPGCACSLPRDSSPRGPVIAAVATALLLFRRGRRRATPRA